jgi:predicted transcriptional regulator
MLHSDATPSTRASTPAIQCALRMPEIIMPRRAALISVLFHEAPTCLECAASKSGLTVSQVNQYLTMMISPALQVVRLDNQSCRLCGEARPVFSVRRSVN